MATLQIDSVNVFARSHYMPLFSRLGPYDTAALDRLLFARRAPYVEYWAHVAVVHPRRGLGAVPLPHGRHAREVRHRRPTAGSRRTARSSTGCAPSSPTADRCGPAQIEHDAKKGARGPWWDWDVVKHALEYLWMFGEVAIAGGAGSSGATRWPST